jgi:putative addiction module killer protein
MYLIKRTDEFNDWLNCIRDGMTQRRLVKRLQKAMLGNLGDIKPVGDGVFEMRENFGPGWRMYYREPLKIRHSRAGGNPAC